MTRDVYKTRNAGAVGPHAQASNTTITENYGPPLQGIDLQALADQLAQLKQEMLKEATGTEHFTAIASISAAEDAARKNQGSTVVEQLKAAGSWAFGIASKIGVSVASKALEDAMGLGK
jgi:hypothetical protein